MKFRTTTKKENMTLLISMLVINAYAQFNPTAFLIPFDGIGPIQRLLVAILASWLALGFSMMVSTTFFENINQSETGDEAQ